MKIFSGVLLLLCCFAACASQKNLAQISKQGQNTSSNHSGVIPDGTTPQAIGGPESVSFSRFQPIMGTRGMVVSDDHDASAWGAEILRQGGNAIDAAVATSFALAVTRPHYAALGGGGFLLYCPHSTSDGPSKCQAIDYREKAPSAATRDLFIRNGKGDTNLSQNGALAAGVPGTTAGLLFALEKFGTVPRQKILSRPIQLAKQGYVFTTHSESAATERWKHMNFAAKKIFGCPKGDFASKKFQTSSLKLSVSASNIPETPCPVGTVIRQSDLGQVLEAISQRGAAGFYQGTVAKKIVHGLKTAGGILSLEDLQSYHPKMREVLKGEFKGHEIISMPPPSSGGVVLLQLLNYAQRADQNQHAFKNGFGSVDTIHALSYGMALAFADRAQYMGDPDFVKVPLSTLLSPNYLDQQWKKFQTESFTTPTVEVLKETKEPQYTTHLAVIDHEGNAVSLTTTVNDNFGSGFVPPGTGVVMNNEMDDFSIQPGVPNMFGLVGNDANAIAPNKRPLSSMTPTIVRDSKGNVEIVIGAAGGPRIISSVFLSLFNRFEFGMSLTDAVAAPRIHQQWKPVYTKIERFSFSPETLSILSKRGHQFSEVTTLGKVHALERFSSTGRTLGVPDPRGEGSAVPE